MLFNASASTDPNSKAQLMSPVQELQNLGCLEFYYNAYGFNYINKLKIYSKN